MKHTVCFTCLISNAVNILLQSPLTLGFKVSKYHSALSVKKVEITGALFAFPHSRNSNFLCVVLVHFSISFDCALEKLVDLM